METCMAWKSWLETDSRETEMGKRKCEVVRESEIEIDSRE